MEEVSRRDRRSLGIADEGRVFDVVEEILRGEQESEATDDERQGRRRDPRLGYRNNVSIYVGIPIPWEHQFLGNTNSLGIPIPWEYQFLGNTQSLGISIPWEYLVRQCLGFCSTDS